MDTGCNVQASKDERKGDGCQEDAEPRASFDDFPDARAITFPDDMEQRTTCEHPPRISEKKLADGGSAEQVTYLNRGS